MRPGEILDARNDYLDRLEDSTFAKVQNTFGDMEWGRSGGWTHKPEPGDAPVTHLQRNLLKVADVYRVTHDMSTLVEYSSLSLDEDDTFDWSLAPTRNGFVAFDRPLPVLDQRGKQMLVHFLMWGAIDTGTGIPSTICWTFNDLYRQPDEVGAGLLEDATWTQEQINLFQQKMGRWAAVSSQIYMNGQNLGPALVPTDSEASMRLTEAGIEAVPGTNLLRYVHALWLMMGQTIARVEPEVPERASRRRATKRQLPSAVTVVKLRREGAPAKAAGESQIEWQHRWVVKGHWRWQACGEGHALAQETSPGVFRARLWINPFVKGPAGAPFKQSEKIYSLER